MSQAAPLVITVSRQLGAGGARLGQWLAGKLNILYVDREILARAAQQLEVTEKDLEHRDEAVTPLWQSLLLSSDYVTPGVFEPAPISMPTDQELFRVESEIISWIAGERSAVIMGRCGSYVLRNHSRHVSVFLHADQTVRMQRVKEAAHLSDEEALKLVISIDKARTHYFRKFTGQDWVDSRQYHICLDTGRISLEKACEIVLSYIQSRFGNAGSVSEKTTGAV
jgi:CMP/dCMP kinase